MNQNGRIINFAGGGEFFHRVILTIWTFFKAFCEYWTSIKIKISMTCAYKEYEIETKMVQERWIQLKWSFYWVITWELLFSDGGRGGGGIKLWWEGIKILWRGEPTGGDFPWCGAGIKNFSAGGWRRGRIPHPPQ